MDPFHLYAVIKRCKKRSKKMAPCILLCFSNTGVSVVTGDEQCHNLLIQNSELCYQSSLLPTYGGRWPTHTIVGTLYSVGDLFRGGTYRRVAAGVAVKMVSSQPAGKQSLLKSSHGLEKVGSRRRREDDTGEKKKAKRYGILEDYNNRQHDIRILFYWGCCTIT